MLCRPDSYRRDWGSKSIGHVASILVPGMALLIWGPAVFILAINFTKIPEAFLLILHSAWNGQAATGGFLGATMMMAIQMGVARSVFSNEAGLEFLQLQQRLLKRIVRAAKHLITMTGALISTVIVCTMTGIVLAVTNVVGTMVRIGADAQWRLSGHRCF